MATVDAADELAARVAAVALEERDAGDDGADDSGKDSAGPTMQLVADGAHGRLAAVVEKKQKEEAKEGEHDHEQGKSRASGPLLPVPLPPSAALSPEYIRARITDEYLLNLDALSVHDPALSQRFWQPSVQPEDLFLPMTSESPYMLQVERDPITFEAKAFRESHVSSSETAVSSMSMTRTVAANADKTYGSTLQYPFMPGGMGVEVAQQMRLLASKKDTHQQESHSADADSKLTQPDLSLFDFPENKVLPDLGDVSAHLPPPPSSSSSLAQQLALAGLLDDLALPLTREGEKDTSSTSTSTTTTAAATATTTERQEGQQAEESSAVTSSAAVPALSELTAAAASGTGEESMGSGGGGGEEEEEEEGNGEDGAGAKEEVEEDLEAALTKTYAQANAQSTGQEQTKNWAITIPVKAKVEDFEFQVPNPAITYPFELDDFQKQAIICMERHESVFVAAHTSAGKTVVAEYAIAMSQKHMTRVIYTSPIKALSNQKFRDFATRFDDVGLLTGDVQIRPDASCLIMTTEILRSMLYRGADMIRDVEWVIFDEVHYINNAERGVVWEETIIMLPKHVNVVMLSATVPNTFEFADWVGRTRKQRVYVIHTPKRPVPLEHFLYVGKVGKADPLFKIVDAHGKFHMKNHSAAVAGKKEGEGKKAAKTGSYGPKKRGNASWGGDRVLYRSLVQMLKKENLNPCVVFTFSKKRCDQNAYNLRGTSFNTAEEEGRVNAIFHRSISILKGSDAHLPQVERIKAMVRHGVGVHHSGLLPIMKELVEILFSQGLIKVLFATETFAMGVNMPAKCVVFDSIRKHDGIQLRDLLPGEYVQMAGRAGRRGLDTTGTVIVLCKGDVPDVNSLHTVMLGKPTVLASRFRLTYNMILNLLRVEDLRVEDMMRQSFSEADLQRETSSQRQALVEGQAQLAVLGSEEFPSDLEEYYTLAVEYLDASHRMMAAILASNNAMRIVGAEGRVVVVNSQMYRNTLAVVLRTMKSSNGPAAPKDFEVLIMVDETSKQKPGQRKEKTNKEESLLPLPVTHLDVPQGAVSHAIVRIAGTDIVAITGEKIPVDKKKVVQQRNATECTMVAQQLQQLAAKGLESLSQLHPIKDLGVKQLEAADAHTRMKALYKQLSGFECTSHPDFTSMYGRLHERRVLMNQIDSLQHQLSDRNLTLLPEYEQRIEVMQRLQFINSERIVQLKGRVACEITTCNELLVTQLIFHDILTPLDPEEVVALLSCMVFQNRRASEPRLTPRLEEGVSTITRMAIEIAETQLACGMQVSVEEYLEEFKFGLVEVVYEWARGMAFKQITELTDEPEGSIVRCIIRLEQACREVRNAARVIGDPVLSQKMEQAANMIKRDIVFAASLYTVDQ
ncbi:ATP-dependent DEAD/H RNA helicase [Salpingoeca rosetta]|uniref:ATP-dependent DEAD/H RNA helicase n=1 Tax=Salpingoeca rosetta (strain ATCC 50818 / BSB-021) TaxID=946362 RepID=F2UCI8_SALR5|nr:ATP-dependent DEAD/H RNA helicase [Salpingoeca rosetta]EGD74295.1 ATP-dependent DEAD/H RNA helicase [Salpingoeca rosetta]|eukprot:XP_004993195.1 ATP-dependent DEAD/H RNA helicase [Salpingoeca rosetta]